jgi:hypothetical protein
MAFSSPRSLNVGANALLGVTKPAPAPVTAPVPTLPSNLKISPLPVATHVIVPITGAPSISLPTAVAVVQAAANGSASAQQMLTATSTAAGVPSGNPTAQGNQALVALADRINVQAQYVGKWFGQAYANQILAGAHLGTPVVQTSSTSTFGR